MAHLRQEVAGHDRADAAYLDFGVALLELAGMGVELYESQDALERRRFLNFLRLNSEFHGDSVKVAWKKPFDGLAQSISEADPEKTRTPDLSDGGSRWRGVLETARTFCFAPEPEVRAKVFAYNGLNSRSPW